MIAERRKLFLLSPFYLALDLEEDVYNMTEGVSEVLVQLVCSVICLI